MFPHSNHIKKESICKSLECEQTPGQRNSNDNIKKSG